MLYAKTVFLPSLWVEFKSFVNMNPAEAVKQLHDSLAIKKANIVTRDGYFIGVQGRGWLFMEYNVHSDKVDGKTKGYIVTTHPFLAEHPTLPEDPQRPKLAPSAYKELNPDTGEGYDLDVVKDHDLIVEILMWINGAHKPRDLSAVRNLIYSDKIRGASTSTISTNRRIQPPDDDEEVYVELEAEGDDQDGGSKGVKKAFGDLKKNIGEAVGKGKGKVKEKTKR